MTTVKCKGLVCTCVCIPRTYVEVRGQSVVVSSLLLLHGFQELTGSTFDLLGHPSTFPFLSSAVFTYTHKHCIWSVTKSLAARCGDEGL